MIGAQLPQTHTYELNEDFVYTEIGRGSDPCLRYTTLLRKMLAREDDDQSLDRLATLFWCFPRNVRVDSVENTKTVSPVGRVAATTRR